MRPEEIQPLLERVDLQRRELEGQNAELERAVFARREFTSNVSHEMKSPLQVIGGYAELMESGMVDASDVPRFAGLIRREAQSMRGLIDDVLTLSRLDERVDAPLLPVDLSAVARRVCARLADHECGDRRHGGGDQIDHRVADRFTDKYGRSAGAAAS